MQAIFIASQWTVNRMKVLIDKNMDEFRNFFYFFKLAKQKPGLIKVFTKHQKHIQKTSITF